jgi:hypothetical protein
MDSEIDCDQIKAYRHVLSLQHSKRVKSTYIMVKCGGLGGIPDMSLYVYMLRMSRVVSGTK